LIGVVIVSNFPAFTQVGGWNSIVLGESKESLDKMLEAKPK
ncbi:MAG: hypothetical protein ACI9QN_001504, partial [Arcticibacterium sp.]